MQRQAGVNQNGIGWFSSGLARSVGTFIGPNTLALFLALVFYLNLSVLPPHKFRWLILLLYSVGILFSGSRTGLLIILLLIFINLYTKLSKLYPIIKDKLLICFFGIPLFLIISTSALSHVNSLSGRTQSASGDGRVDILKSYFSETDTLSLIFGKYLGYGSNLVQILNKNTGANNEYFLADSTLTSILTQFGFLGVFIFICIICILINNSSRKKYYIQNYNLNYFSGGLRQDKVGFLIYFINTAATIIIFEFYACLPLIITLLFLFRLPQFIQSSPISNQRGYFETHTISPPLDT
ncbi:MAG: hypothetical protein IGS39_19620 [Calothrix sp. C42_A2020_038]|nr:hypothetical protein [Calothrix sp. C42_A2020_038]